MRDCRMVPTMDPTGASPVVPDVEVDAELENGSDSMLQPWHVGMM